MKHFLLMTLTLAACVSVVCAHDTWLETNTNVVRAGDVIYVDCLLGNHGNDHRDFKVAGKVTFLPADTWQVVGPDGKVHDLRPTAVDRGYAPKEGFWTARFQPDTPGVYLASQTSDRVVDYAPKRSVKSAKTFFIASKSLDDVPESLTGFDRVLGHALELVPLDNPVTPIGPGSKLRVKLLYQGKPLPGTTVSFIPRGHVLREGFDETYERKTDADGVATFEPKEANLYLIVAHVSDTSDSGKGKGFDETKYGATMTVIVPGICPCCSE